MKTYRNKIKYLLFFLVMTVTWHNAFAVKEVLANSCISGGVKSDWNITVKKEKNTRLMSYNIRNARGLDEITNYDRIAGIIGRVNPDVIAIQELDSVTNRSKGADVLNILAQKMGLIAIYAASIEYDGGKYGIGILSKEKPLSVKRIHLPGSEEKRMLLIVEFKNFYFGNTHFSLNTEDRLESVKIINREVKKLNPEKPFILAGDMNATPESEVQKSINTVFTSFLSPMEYTIPADNPDRCIDYIYGYHGFDKWIRLTGSGVIAEKNASDHRPLYADFEIISEEQ